MGKISYSKIKKLQKECGFEDVQNNINSGLCWKLEGSYGRYAMGLLISGACMLPKVSHKDYYGDIVPSRDELKKGTTGTFGNSQRYWEAYLNGDIN